MTILNNNKVKIGLGLRRDILDEFISQDILTPDFIELAPENWIDITDDLGKKLQKISTIYPLVCHGLSLSLGSPQMLDYNFMHSLKEFISTNKVEIYSEHLSYTKSLNAHLYDLLPIPFTHEAVNHVALRIREAQHYLGRTISIENVSYYTEVAKEMEEVEFINNILEKADCKLLLDVNNVYVNAFNHGYSAVEFIENINKDRIEYIHMAGHERVSDTLIIDTHGADIIDPVFQLFDYTASLLPKSVPVLLERDFNFNNLDQLQREMNVIRTIAENHWGEEEQNRTRKNEGFGE